MPENMIVTARTRFVSSRTRRPHLLRNSASALVLAQVLLASGGVARADDTWTGATSTDWFTATNWALGAVPTTGRVTATTSANAPVIDGQTAQAAYLTVGSGGNTVLTGGNLTIQNGGQLNLSGTGNSVQTYDYISGDNPTVTVTGKGSKLITAAGSFLFIGWENNNRSRGNGSLNILDGAEVTVSNLSSGSNVATPSTLKVSGLGSVLNILGGNGGGKFGYSNNNSLGAVVEISDGGKLVTKTNSFTGAKLTATGIGSIVEFSNSNTTILTTEQSGFNVLDGGEFDLIGTNTSYTLGGKTTVDGAGSVFKDQSLQGTLTLGINNDASPTGTLTVSNGGRSNPREALYWELVWPVHRAY
ncbi:hypothetical protein [Brucella rhizosphaerae]|uniref:hypothetical protein n=1 Tax=Brucella rhizosphaerae TaxID=571254 RepID=UPI00361A4A14